MFYVSMLSYYLSEIISYEKKCRAATKARSLLKDPFVNLLTKIFPFIKLMNTHTGIGTQVNWQIL